MEEAMFQELLEEADDPDINQSANVIGLALTQLLAIEPTRGQHSPRCELRIGEGHHHLGEIHTHHFGKAGCVLTLLYVVQLFKEPEGLNFNSFRDCLKHQTRYARMLHTPMIPLT